MQRVDTSIEDPSSLQLDHQDVSISVDLSKNVVVGIDESSHPIRLQSW